MSHTLKNVRGKNVMERYFVIFFIVVFVIVFMVCGESRSEINYEDGKYVLEYNMSIEDDLTIVTVLEDIPSSEYENEGKPLPIPSMYVSEDMDYNVLRDLS